MIVKCPECGKDGRFSWLGEPDQCGVIAMVTHIVGKKIIKDVMGVEQMVDDVRYHFLKLNQIEDLKWFKEWQIKEKKFDKEAMEKMNKEFDEMYWKEVEKEYEHL